MKKYFNNNLCGFDNFIEKSVIGDYNIIMKGVDNMVRPRKRKPINADYRLFGEKIQSLRQARGLTQVELANKLKLSKTTLADYELGLIRIPLSPIKMFAEYFNVSIDELIGLQLSNNKNDIQEYNKKWYDEFKSNSFTDNEIDELINYGKYILSKRNK